ncbi:MAG: polysaccharide deacetylase family protein [Polyangia bacterium]
MTDSKWLRSTLKSVLASKWMWQTLMPLLRPRGVSVLAYHRILGANRDLNGAPVEIFEQQMRWVREHCDPIAPDALVDRAERPNRARPAVLVTFDDGFRDYHDLAYPVLKRLGIPALMFLPTSHIDHGSLLWTDRVQWAAQSTTHSSIRLPWADGAVVALPDAGARAALGQTARDHLKTMPDSSRRAAIETLVAELGEPPPRPREMMTWDEVRVIMDLTWIGGHSHTHPILSQLSRDDLEREIGICRDRIAAETGRTPTLFAYPNGGPADYNAETQTVLKQCGFKQAFCTTEGMAGPQTDWMAIRRIGAPLDPSPAAFAWRLAGMHLR